MSVCSSRGNDRIAPAGPGDPGTSTGRRSAVEAAAHRLRAGGIVLIHDATGSDLAFAASGASAMLVNRMTKDARGLVSLALPASTCDRLGLDVMAGRPARASGRPRQPFTTSIDAREGVTTGISAADRARTLRVAADPDATAHDVVSPGHVVPLRIAPDATPTRAWAALELLRLADCTPAAALCTILDDRGGVVPGDDAGNRFAVPAVSVEDLAAHLRSEQDSTLTAGPPTSVRGHPGFWSQRFVDDAGRAHHAICRGTLGPGDATPVAIVIQDLAGDLLAQGSGDSRIGDALLQLAVVPRGVVLYIDGTTGRRSSPANGDHATTPAVADRILHALGVEEATRFPAKAASAGCATNVK